MTQLQVRPQTVEEANIMIAKAIANNDFATAKELKEELDLLQNYQNEVKLAKDVYDYYENKQKLSDTMNQNIKTYLKQIEETRINLIEEYRKTFLATKSRQTNELENIITNWGDIRNSQENPGMQDYQNLLETARILATNGKFDEAIKLKEEADEKLKHHSKVNNKAIDKMYKKKCNIMIERHRNEIKALYEHRCAELGTLDSLEQAVHSQALEQFLVHNAAEVMEIAKRFPNNSLIPKSLEMQVIHSKPMEPTSSQGPTAADPSFTQKMSSVQKNLNISIKSTPKSTI